MVYSSCITSILDDSETTDFSKYIIWVSCVCHELQVVFLQSLLGGTGAVLFDEPTSGIDPESRRLIWTIMRTLIECQPQPQPAESSGAQLSRSGILTTHSLEEAEALCSRVAIIIAGRISALGTCLTLQRLVNHLSLCLTADVLHFGLCVACRNNSRTEREAAGGIRIGVGAVVAISAAAFGVDLCALAECANRRAVRGLSADASAKGQRSLTRSGV